jgi:hypothetical protein
MTADVKRRLPVVANEPVESDGRSNRLARGIVERARDRFTPPVEPAPGGL